MIELTDEQVRGAYHRLRSYTAFPSEPMKTEPYQAGAGIIAKLAEALGVSFETILEGHRPLQVTPQMIRLGASNDRRKWKRAWRLYFKANGKNAARSFFHEKVRAHRSELVRRRLAQWAHGQYQAWIKDAVASGQIELPSTEAQERK